MIEIQDLQGKTKSEIISLISEQESSPLRIYIPKSTMLSFNTKEEIAMDYTKLAFAGHLLKNSCTKFHYKEVPPEAHESVEFNVEASNIDVLSSVLLEISFGYVNDEEEEVYQDIEGDCDFWMNADQYLSDVNDGRIKDVACPYFCQIAQQFFNEMAED